MFSKIKSSYIIKAIFSFVYEKKKLELVIYNKNMQNKLEINSIHYKFFSGKYIYNLLKIYYEERIYFHLHYI